MAKPDPQALEILYAAHRAAIGIVVSVSDATRALQRLYAARRLLGDPDLDTLQFRRSTHNPEGEIWIVKGAPRGE